MTRERAKELLPVIQAYAEGKQIEIYSPVFDTWQTALPHWLDGGIYRIKLEPESRPYKEVCEDWVGKKVKSKSDGSTYLIMGVMPGIDELHEYVVLPHNSSNLPAMYHNFTWQDGSPFGEEADA